MVQPLSGSLAVLEAVNARTVDVALVQGGLDVPLPNVRHVTAVLPETVHMLARDADTHLQKLALDSLHALERRLYSA